MGFLYLCIVCTRTPGDGKAIYGPYQESYHPVPKGSGRCSQRGYDCTQGRYASVCAVLAPCRAVLAAPLPCFWTSQTPYSVQTGHGGAPSAFDGPQPLPRSVHTPAPYVDLTGCSFGPFPLDIASPGLCLLPCRLRVGEFLLSLAKIRTSLCSVLGLPNSA